MEIPFTENGRLLSDESDSDDVQLTSGTMRGSEELDTESPDFKALMETLIGIDDDREAEDLISMFFEGQSSPELPDEAQPPSKFWAKGSTRVKSLQEGDIGPSVFHKRVADIREWYRSRFQRTASSPARAKTVMSGDSEGWDGGGMPEEHYYLSQGEDAPCPTDIAPPSRSSPGTTRATKAAANWATFTKLRNKTIKSQSTIDPSQQDSQARAAAAGSSAQSMNTDPASLALTQEHREGAFVNTASGRRSYADALSSPLETTITPKMGMLEGQDEEKECNANNTERREADDDKEEGREEDEEPQESGQGEDVISQRADNESESATASWAAILSKEAPPPEPSTAKLEQPEKPSAPSVTPPQPRLKTSRHAPVSNSTRKPVSSRETASSGHLRSRSDQSSTDPNVAPPMSREEKLAKMNSSSWR